MRGLNPPWHVVLLLLGITLSMFSGWAGHLGLPISLDRLVLPLALVLILFDRNADRPQRRLPTGLMTVFVLIAVASMAYHRMATDPSALFALADRVVIPFLVLVAAALAFDSPARRGLLLWWVAALGAWLGVTALLEVVRPELVWPSYITDPDVGMHVGRARGPFVAADAMGLALFMTALCAGALALTRRGWLRWLLVGVTVLNLVGVALSLTRSAWLGAALGLVAAALADPRTRRWTLPAGMVSAGVFTAVMLASSTLRGALRDRLFEANPVYDRLGSTQAALSLLQDRPLLGIGWRRFYPHGAEWVRQTDVFPINHVVIEIHNVVLSRTAELGLPAGAIFLAILALGLARPIWDPVLRRGPLGPVAVGAAVAWLAAGMFSPLAVPFPNLLVSLLCGAAFAAVGTRDEPSAQRAAPMRPSAHDQHASTPS